MPRLEKAMKDLMEIFEEYANGDGKLNKGELMNLLDKEIDCPDMKEKIKSVNFDRIMRRMDKNHDQEIDFAEFLLAFRFLAKCCHHKKTGRCHVDED